MSTESKIRQTKIETQAVHAGRRIDPVTGAELEDEFRSLAARLGKTIVFVTHNLQAALLNQGRIALLARGCLAGIYTAEQFPGSPDPEVRAFMASLSSRNGKSVTTKNLEGEL